MKENKIRKVISFVFADDGKFSIEKRILLSSIVVGIFLTIFAAIANAILTLALISVIIPLLITIVLLVIYYFVRFRVISQSVITIIIIIGIISGAVVWIFNGGINGGNIMPALVVLILGLLVVPDRTKKYIFILFLFANILIMLIQLFKPEFIEEYPSETARWFDILISLVYSSYFIYLIIRYFHKHYTIEKLKAEENEKKFRILYDNSPDMYLSVSATDATILMCNQTFIKNLGYSKEEIIGKPVFILNYNQNSENDLSNFQQFLKTGIIRNRELIIRKKDGSKMEVSLNADAVCDDNQKILYSISSWRDISEQKEAELKIIQQNEELQKLNSDKDRFISILAHDLKNPFNSLLGFTDLLLKRIHKLDKNEIEQQLILINQVSHQTYNLLDDLLIWSKSQSGKLVFNPEKINFYEISNEIINNLQHQADLKMIKINLFTSEESLIMADSYMFKTILRNLVSNAIKFTNKNGQISVYSVKEDSNLIITVSDNGTGIEKENLDKIWDFSQPYTSTGTDGEKGTGVGLLLCKEFVERHGGRIWLESETGKGSQFKFSLPLY